MIVAVGISLVDIILVMNGFRCGDGSFHCERMYTEGGGMAATALCAAARLGSKTRLLSRVGDDVHGRFVKDGLEEFGVDTTGMLSIRDRNTTVSIVLVDRNTGDKQFYSEFDKPAYLDPADADLSLLDDADILLVDGHWTDLALRSVRRARKRGIPVVSDFKRMYPGLEHLFPYIDYHILPLFFASEITGESSPGIILRKIHTLYGGIPVITSGSEGGFYLNGDELLSYRTFPLEHTVDSTGAGDAFHGAFCHFLEKGEPIGRCLELASAVGSLNCRAYGGRKALPTQEELSAFLVRNGSEPLF